MAQADPGSPFGVLIKKGQLPAKAVAFPVEHPTKTSPSPTGSGTAAAPGPSEQQGTAVLNSATAHQIVVSAGFDADMPSADEIVIANLLRSGSDTAVADAFAYFRGTAYHAQKYPGYASGVHNSLFESEAGFNAWKNGAADSYQRYYGRPPTSEELTNFATLGYNNSTIEQIGGGHAWSTANAPDVQYELGAFDTGQITQADLETLGQQNVGRQSVGGGILQDRVNKAISKMQRLFEGTLANPNFQLGGAGLQASSLQGTKQKPDTPA